MKNSIINISALDDIARVDLSKKIDKRTIIKNFLITFRLLQTNNSLRNKYKSLGTELSRNDYNKNSCKLHTKIEHMDFSTYKFSIIYGIYSIMDFILSHTTTGHIKAIMEIINRRFADLCYKAFVVICGLPYLIFKKFFNHIGLHIRGFSIFNLSTKSMSDQYLGEVCIGFFLIPIVFFIAKKIILAIYYKYLLRHLKTLDDLEFNSDLEKYSPMFEKNIKIKNEINDQIKTNNSKINNNSLIPSAYRFNCNAIYFFIYCLTNGRADTLKECINLYHTESYRKNILNYLHTINWNVNNLYSTYSDLEYDIGSMQSDIAHTEKQNQEIIDKLK